MRETNILGILKMCLCNHARVCKDNKLEINWKKRLSVKIFCGKRIDCGRLYIEKQ